MNKLSGIAGCFKFTIKLTAVMLFSMTMHLSGQVSFGTSEKINESWLFRLGDVRDFRTVNRERWRKINLPHDWSVEGQLSYTLASSTGYLPGGIGWYHKTIQIPESKRGEKVYLYFEGVYNRSEVFINNKPLGLRPNGYISFMYDVTSHIEYGKDNTIDVKVDHSRSADSRWYTGSGIYRDVWIVYANPVHISQWGVYAYLEVQKNKNELKIEVEIDNTSAEISNLTVVNELLSPEGKIVGKASKKLTVNPGNTDKITASLNVNKPVLWDVDNPVLYKLVTTVFKNGKEIDRCETTTGFRYFTFDPNKGFALNGKWMKLKGVCLHHDAGVLGAAVSRDVWKRRIQTLKSIGCNAIRTSHNPQAPDLYELCDELGMLVLNEAYDEWEFPKRKWLEGWNVGTPGFEGSYDFFEEWGEKDLADMVRRDRNHISVFAWSIGNEVDYPNDPYSHPVLDGKKGETGFTQPIFGGYKKDAPDAMRLGGIAKRLVAVVKKYDKSRPTTAGLAGVVMSNETEYPGALDITGYNYSESLYDEDHKTYPNRIIYGSENRHDFSVWKVARDKEFILGMFLWTGIDHLGESRLWPARGYNPGLLDFGSFIKPRGYFRQSLWSDKPMAYLGTYPIRGAGNQNTDVWSQLEFEKQIPEKTLSMDAWPVWNYEKGQTIRVVCYTNAAKAQLTLNGKNIGEAKEYDNNTGIIYWDIPYEEGKLEVKGLNNKNEETARYMIQSSKLPYALKIISSEKEIDKIGLAQVVIQVVDENDVPVILSDNEITCLISGPAVLKGLEASNNHDISDYTDNRHRVFNGRILAYIQPTGEAGEVKIRFTSPLLKSVETSISVK